MTEDPAGTSAEGGPDNTFVPPETKVNLGCGDDYREEYHNVDVDPSFDVDQVVDLEKIPWPLPDDHFEEALLDNVLEHIDPRQRPGFLSEAHRVLVPGGEMVVRLPTQVGWDVTHYAVPSHRWPYHPDNAGQWDVLDIETERVGPGRIMPTKLALLCTEYDVVRCLSQVEVRVRATTETETGTGD